MVPKRVNRDGEFEAVELMVTESCFNLGYGVELGFMLVFTVMRIQEISVFKVALLVITQTCAILLVDLELVSHNTNGNLELRRIAVAGGGWWAMELGDGGDGWANSTHPRTPQPPMKSTLHRSEQNTISSKERRREEEKKGKGELGSGLVGGGEEAREKEERRRRNSCAGEGERIEGATWLKEDGWIWPDPR
ncbi:hypothetical protein Droror1_Dr00026954 [Drosera rotundifolia]